MAQSNSNEKTLRMQQKCFCGSKLLRYNRANTKRGWTCQCCFQLFKKRVNYWCNKGAECIYKNTSSGAYIVCPQCYGLDDTSNSLSDVSGSKKEDNMIQSDQHVFEKVKKSLDQIR